MSGVIDWLLKAIESAAERRTVSRTKYFDEYVEPARTAAEKIYHDYCEVLETLRRYVETASCADPIIAYLEDCRRPLQSARDSVRAEITQRMREGGVTRFEAGILGLITGAVSAVDRPYFHTLGYEQRTGAILPRPGNHTVLDLLMKLRTRSGNFASMRPELRHAIAEKEKGIESAWRNVITGYAELRASLKLPRIRALPKHSPTFQDDVVLIEMYLQQIHQMLTLHQFERELPKRLQKIVAAHLPELEVPAENLREVIHDLNENEPGVTEKMLESCLDGFERALDDALRTHRRIQLVGQAPAAARTTSRRRKGVRQSRRTRPARRGSLV